MATENENKPQRRIEDKLPAAQIDWSKPDAPAVALPHTAGAARQGGNTSDSHAATQPLDAAALNRLEALAKAATPGPWANDRGYLNGPEVSYEEWHFTNEADTEFIVAVRNSISALIAQARAAQAHHAAATTGEDARKLAHGHRDDYYLMANGRRLAQMPIAEVKAMPNWVLAKHLFATGSTSARQICIDARIDPDDFAVWQTAPNAIQNNEGNTNV